MTMMATDVAVLPFFNDAFSGCPILMPRLHLVQNFDVIDSVSVTWLYQNTENGRFATTAMPETIPSIADTHDIHDHRLWRLEEYDSYVPTSTMRLSDGEELNYKFPHRSE